MDLVLTAKKDYIERTFIKIYGEKELMNIKKER